MLLLIALVNIAFCTNTNSMLLDDSYYFTKEGNLFTTQVTTAKMGDNGMFELGSIVSSEKLKVGDFVWWPKFDLKNTIAEVSVVNNIVMKVGHHNITNVHSRCCASISVNLPPACVVKFCCGGGCCC